MATCPEKLLEQFEEFELDLEVEDILKKGEGGVCARPGGDTVWPAVEAQGGGETGRPKGTRSVGGAAVDPRPLPSLNDRLVYRGA